MKATVFLSLILVVSPAFSQTEKVKVSKTRSKSLIEKTAPSSVTTVLLTVNGDPVMQGELDIAVRTLTRRVMQSGGTVDPGALEAQAEQQIIDSRLLAQEARRRGLEPDSEQVEQVIAGLAKRAGGRDKIGDAIGVGGLPSEKVEAMVAEGMLVNTFTKDHLMSKIEISDEQISAYYEENKKQYEIDDQVHARHIIFRVAADAPDEAKLEARAKAEAARERVLTGEDFVAVAKDVSEGQQAANGGDLGFFEHRRMVPAFADVAFALDPGKISEVVETRFGFHVIKAEARRPAGVRPLAEVRDGIRATLAQEHLGDTVENLLKPLREKAVVVHTPEPAKSAGAE